MRAHVLYFSVISVILSLYQPYLTVFFGSKAQVISKKTRFFIARGISAGKIEETVS
jgi:hypothetical protein